MPAIGAPAGYKLRSTSPNTSEFDRTSGNIAREMPKSFNISSSHSPVRRLSNNVRDALVTSVACTRRPVNCHNNQQSTVPNSNFPASARDRAPATLSKIHRIFVAEKYGSSRNPVRSATNASTPSRFSRAQKSAVRRSCHTIALYTGRPDSRSHTMVVSR